MTLLRPPGGVPARFQGDAMVRTNARPTRCPPTRSKHGSRNEGQTRAASNVSLHVGAPGPAVAGETAALLNESLGSGFTQPSALAQLTVDGGGVLIRARGRDGGLLGAATARVLDRASHAALQDRLRITGVDAGLDGRRVGELKSIVVAPAARGTGVGSIMLAASLDFLKARGCRDVVSASWVSADPQHSSLGMLERAGFAQVATIPAFWADDQTGGRLPLPPLRRRVRLRGRHPGAPTRGQRPAAARALPWRGPRCREGSCGRGGRRV